MLKYIVMIDFILKISYAFPFIFVDVYIKYNTSGRLNICNDKHLFI